jgi:Fe-S cluster assembly scaffold protein SufB
MEPRDEMLRALDDVGVDRAVLADPQVAHLLVVGHQILSARRVAGLTVDVRETATGIAARVAVAAGVRIAEPVHLCFGVVHPQGLQEIEMEVSLEREAAARFLAHCLFPNAERVRHIMRATVDIGAGAELHYTETHMHGPRGGVEVLPRAQVRVGDHGRYCGEFNLTSGRVGTLAIDYVVTAGADSVTELTARIFGHGSDRIEIRESVALNGENARGLIKTRIALEDDASAEVTGATEGNAPGARGHVDCLELVKDRAIASAVPIVKVTHPLAKVTHEAAIGSVDRRQMETLMAHGLTPDDAVDIIVNGVLR